MQIIPVMDLSNGRVVHAVKGKRQNYKAIGSHICLSAVPNDVIDGFLNIHDFKTIYIADLDALENQGNHTELIHTICKLHTKITFWLDCGADAIENYMQQINADNLRYILSSESISSLSTFTSILNTYPGQNFILSLDFKADELLGSNDLLFAEKYWPDDVIALNISEVGANSGFIYPAFVKQNRIYENFKLYVGGGIRNMDDILTLSKQGIEGVLISTALHSQAITSDELKAFSQSL